MLFGVVTDVRYTRGGSTSLIGVSNIALHSRKHLSKHASSHDPSGKGDHLLPRKDAGTGQRLGARLPSNSPEVLPNWRPPAVDDSRDSNTV